MKQAYIILLLLSALNATAQKYDWHRAIAPASFAFASGACWGFHETVVHHPDRIPASWNQNYWDARISWTNKYRNNNPENGEKFIGSKTFLAWTTDAKHLFGTAHRLTMFGAGVSAGIVYNQGEKRKWWHYAVDAAITYTAFTIGFHSVYSIAFR